MFWSEPEMLPRNIVGELPAVMNSGFPEGRRSIVEEVVTDR